jgi:DNA-binding GntR family transcriptional regulator
VSVVPLAQRLACDHGLRRQAIAQSLVADVFEGRLQAGKHLVTQELAERFGVSHTPIREALIALAGIGIIDLLPNRGAIVRRVAASDVREICHVRRALECEATRSACGQIDAVELKSIADGLRSLINEPPRPVARFLETARELDSRLHDVIALSCGNAFLAKELNRLKLLFRAFRDLMYTRTEAQNDGERLTIETHQHLAIVEALLANHRAEAVRAMSRHIKSGIKSWSLALCDATDN